jgi:hypothetical protein
VKAEKEAENIPGKPPKEPERKRGEPISIALRNQVICSLV